MDDSFRKRAPVFRAPRSGQRGLQRQPFSGSMASLLPKAHEAAKVVAVGGGKLALEVGGRVIKDRKDLNDELNRRAFRDTLPRFSLQPAGLDNARYTRFAKFLVDQGLIKQALPVESYAVQLAK